MENKYSFQEIDNEIRDSFLRTSKVFDERNKLRNNWNSLRELIIKRLDKYDRLVSKEEGIEIEILMWVRNKMNELEGKDKE